MRDKQVKTVISITTLFFDCHFDISDLSVAPFVRTCTLTDRKNVIRFFSSILFKIFGIL